MRILVVTGMSGAGKSTSLRALEDIGWYCVDNLPLRMLPELQSHLVERGETRDLAVGIDARSDDDLAAFPVVAERLGDAGHQVEVLFLEAPDATLVRRFSETRRRHPLGDLPQAIELEKERLRPVRHGATATINTEKLTTRGLRQVVRDRYGERGTAMVVVLMSFGFKNGAPPEADLLFDARFLSNPYDHPKLRPQSGFDAPVADYVMGQEDAQTLLAHMERHLRFQAPRSVREGRSSLTVAIGCTGGQHRSVALVEALGRKLADSPQGAEGETWSHPLEVRHRDVQRSMNA